MRVLNILAALALLCGTISSNTYAQAPNGAAPAAAVGTKVAVIDMGFIFDNHPTMKDQVAAIDAEIKKAEEEINKRREEVLKQLEILKTFEENTPTFKQQEDKIADAESKLKLDFVRREKEFAEAKAKIIYDTYKQVEGVTKQFAELNQIGLVVRYSRSEMDPKKPTTVAQGINKDIVYFNPAFDLTDGVLNFIRNQSPAAPTQPGGQVQQNAGKPQPGVRR